jgi:hypothetical protein
MFLHKVIDPYSFPLHWHTIFIYLRYGCTMRLKLSLTSQWTYNSLFFSSSVIGLFLWHFSRFGSKAMVPPPPPPPRLFASQSNGSSKAINHLLLGYNVLIERASRKQGGWTNNICVVPQIKSGPFRGQENHPFKIRPKENVNVPCQVSHLQRCKDEWNKQWSGPQAYAFSS